ncbi:hypothetical protein NITMOv2_0885 [Nitrospira moscoviensis]|uniref:Uncharacterized protein n=1 Tax=Nitrospira moscoviensis TaxID=42253 RepID=A0A0K2G8Q6_NITMO|nr:hypothetical protein NITMOv2_0885 [Nitrospira moscoviensis]
MRLWRTADGGRKRRVSMVSCTAGTVATLKQPARYVDIENRSQLGLRSTSISLLEAAGGSRIPEPILGMEEGRDHGRFSRRC